jgi:hypothetical protein
MAKPPANNIATKAVVIRRDEWRIIFLELQNGNESRGR